MKFQKFALTRPTPKEEGNTNFLGRITVYLPDSKKQYGDLQASMFLSGDGISITNSFSGSFTTKFGIRTELTVDELRTISQFCASRAQDIITKIVDTQRSRRQTYSLSAPFGVDIVVGDSSHVAAPTSLVGGDYHIPEVSALRGYTIPSQVPMSW